jgi:hypothetical protein
MVSPKTRSVLWGKGAGRCYYCNVSLIGDLIAGNEDANFGFVAHIVGEKETGPRGDKIRSPQLEDDVSNLMLMCYPHHKLIDVDEIDAYPEQRLLDMKRGHEDRISVVTGIVPERASHILRYGAKIGLHESPVSFERARVAMLPYRYPAGGGSIGIEVLGNIATDGEAHFWHTEPENLRRQFETILRPRIMSREIAHLSVFGLGPMPLLIQLGSLLGDIVPADVYQLHREPAGWIWAEEGNPIKYRIRRADREGIDVALKLAISATVTDNRISNILGEDAPIWSIEAVEPGNDVMRHKSDLREFRRLMRQLYDAIKAQHGENARIHVFPAVPVSVAIEIGRVRMAKSDLPIVIYDNIREQGFVRRLEVI